MRYPAAERLDLVDVIHGHPVPDPYRWLEDADDPRTRAWAAAQDVLTRAHLDALPGRERVAAALRGLVGAGAVGPPVWRGERRFRVRRDGAAEHGVLLLTEPDGTERVLVDPMAIDPSGATTLDAWQPSKEGDLLAYQLSRGGDEESAVHVMDVATGEHVDGPIGRTRYTPVAWLPGGKAFYYVRRLAPDLVPAGEAQYHRRVWLHRLGTDAEDDVEVFGAGQPITSYFGVSVSRDGRWLVISASEGTAPRTDVWLADLDAAPPEAPALVELQRGVDAALWAAVARDGRLYLVTDRDARRRRLLVADPTDPAPAAWRELIPEDPEAVLDDFALLDGPAGPATLLLVARTRHTLAELALHDAATGAWLADVPTPSAGGSLGGLVTRPDGGSAVWFVWTAPDSPGTVYRFDAAAPEASRMQVWEQPPGTAGVVPTPPPLSVRQESYRSADGTTVRVLVLAPPECADGPDRPRPTVLYGYGGFGIALTPAYASAPLAWVAAGGVWAIAGLRGGGEEGEQWHRDGMLGAKQNVFDDFHAAAEHLVNRGWTTPERLAINGGSNGGLLVGAALTQRPDLYRAVVCSAPLLDMIRYEQFGLGASWAVEYGSASVPEEFEWLRAYSPYHRVVDGTRYPAVLFTVFDSDSRVDPLHARKMCAALQHATGGDQSGQDAGQGGAGPRPDGPDDTQPVLLRREADVGHGARALSRTIDLWTDTLTFLGERTGLAW